MLSSSASFFSELSIINLNSLSILYIKFPLTHSYCILISELCSFGYFIISWIFGLFAFDGYQIRFKWGSLLSWVLKFKWKSGKFKNWRTYWPILVNMYLTTFKHSSCQSFYHYFHSFFNEIILCRCYCLVV